MSIFITPSKIYNNLKFRAFIYTKQRFDDAQDQATDVWVLTDIHSPTKGLETPWLTIDKIQ